MPEPSWRGEKRSSSERGCGAKWRRAHLAFLEANPVCERCYARGRVQRASVWRECLRCETGNGAALMQGKLFAAPLAKVAGGLILALGLACPGLWLWGRVGDADGNRWEAKSLAERDNHRATKANVLAA